jgi:hypothetical protein
MLTSTSTAPDSILTAVLLLRLATIYHCMLNPRVLTGKRFRLKVATLGLALIDDKRIAVPIPAGSIVIVSGGPRPNDMRMIDVLWEGQTLTMFAEDVQKRGEEITTTATSG